MGMDGQWRTADELLRRRSQSAENGECPCIFSPRISPGEIFWMRRCKSTRGRRREVRNGLRGLTSVGDHLGANGTPHASIADRTQGGTHPETAERNRRRSPARACYCNVTTAIKCHTSVQWRSERVSRASVAVAGPAERRNVDVQSVCAGKITMTSLHLFSNTHLPRL